MQGRWQVYVEFRRNREVPEKIQEIAGQCSLTVPAYGEPVDGHPQRYQLVVPHLGKISAARFVERCRREAGDYISVAMLERQGS